VTTTSPSSADVSRTYRVTGGVWRQSLVLRQLGLALGSGVLLVALLLIALGDPLTWAYVGKVLGIAGLVAATLLVLAVIAIGVLYGGRYEMIYRLDDEGIEGRPAGGTARRNRAVNLLLLLSGRPTAMGAGLMAASRQVERVAWRQVERCEQDARGHALSLYAGRKRLMVVFTDAATAQALAADISACMARAQAGRQRPT
jgi:hypothetical protein